MDREELLSEFGRAMMVASTGSEGLVEPSLSSLASAIQCREEAEVSQGLPSRGVEGVAGLVEQLGQVDILLARLVASMQAQGVKSQENLANGNTESESGREAGVEDCRGRLREMEEQLAAREAAMVEMRHKFGKNRQILTCNWEQAESEVRRLDEIYHETVDNVMRELGAVPDLVQSYPGLASLVTSLRQSREDPVIQPNANENRNCVGSMSRMSRSLVTTNTNTNTNSSTGLPGLMSQSQGKLLTNSNTSASLSQSILSDPCLLKSPTPSLPSLLSSDIARQQDMNANQSL